MFDAGGDLRWKEKHEKRYRTERQLKERWRTGCVTHQLMRELNVGESTQPSDSKALVIASSNRHFRVSSTLRFKGPMWATHYENGIAARIREVRGSITRICEKVNK